MRIEPLLYFYAGSGLERSSAASFTQRAAIPPRDMCALQIPCCLVLDCKALWDGLARSESSALGMRDKRVAIEALALKRGLASTSTDLRGFIALLS